MQKQQLTLASLTGIGGRTLNEVGRLSNLNRLATDETPIGEGKLLVCLKLFGGPCTVPGCVFKLGEATLSSEPLFSRTFTSICAAELEAEALI